MISFSGYFFLYRYSAERFNIARSPVSIPASSTKKSGVWCDGVFVGSDPFGSPPTKKKNPGTLFAKNEKSSDPVCGLMTSVFPFPATRSRMGADHAVNDGSLYVYNG